MNSPLRPQAARRSHAAHAARGSAAALLIGALCWRALFAPPIAVAQTDPKAPHVDPMPPSAGARDVTPHPGVVIAGNVVIGQLAPTFELDGSEGRPVQLTSLRGDWVALVFLARMTDATQFGETQRALSDVGVHLVGVCHDKARSVESFAARTRLEYLLLADVTGEVGAIYGVWDSAQRDFMPGLVLIDPHGIVHDATIGHAFSPDEVRDFVLTSRQKS